MKNLKAFLFSDHRAPASLPLDAQMLAATGVLDPTVAWIPSGDSPEKTPKSRSHRNRKAWTHRINYLILKTLSFEHPFRIIETTEFLPESE